MINNGAAFSHTSILGPNCIQSLEVELNASVLGLVRMAHAFGPILKDNGGGAFVQINSIVALKPIPVQATYTATKAASQSLTLLLQLAFAEQGTSVLSVLPGPFATGIVKGSGFADMAEPASLCADEILAALKRGDRHVFPGTIAGKIGQYYQDFRETIVEPDIEEVMGRLFGS